MFTVVIPHPEQGQKAIQFKTDNRNVARMAALVGNVAGVVVKVTEEVAPRPVKFKGLD